MDKDTSQGMRISLPPGTKVTGEKETYEVKKFICMSSRSVTVLCETSKGILCRLKLFNGQHCITNAVQRKTMSVATKGVIQPVDIGEYGGCPFAVYLNADATDTGKYPISQTILTQKIIPQLSYVVNRYHQMRILLRDICPENVLYKVHEQQIAYCGFSNMTVLPDKVTVTRAAGYGQHPSFVAPEVPKYGYSTCSDYYSLGVSFLSMMLGKNPMQDMTREEILRYLSNGKVPGIDVEHLRNTPYALYSEEDKVLYLVLGLMLPNPRDRWGIGEIRCWCNNQQIPLTRKGGRIPYQYNEPFVVNNIRCWNDQQLTQIIASEKSAWSDETFSRLEQFAGRQNIAGWQEVLDAVSGSKLTADGRIFRAVYGINPGLDGFWWEGKRYQDTEALVRDAISNQASNRILSDILKEQCLSYFLKMRKRISAVPDSEIHETEQIEQWEIAEPGKGVNRCVMRFAGSTQKRTFRIDGKEYRDLEQLIGRYNSSGTELKKMSASILNNKSFQAWLWANGMEAAGDEARKTAAVHPEQSFYLLLKIAESSCTSESAKQKARMLYLKYGEYAPIYWLTDKIGEYRSVAIGAQVLYDVFKNANLTAAEPLEKLSAKAGSMVSDYQHFASRTAKSPLEVECLAPELSGYAFYPIREDGFFCCTWENTLEVTPAFLRSVGESVQKRSLDGWIGTSVNEVGEKLDSLISDLPFYGSPLSKSDYIGQCETNIVLSVIMMAAAVVLLVLYARYTVAGWVKFAAALLFPISALFRYFRKKARAGTYYDQKDRDDNIRASYERMRSTLNDRGAGVVSRIMKNAANTLTPYQAAADPSVNAAMDIEGIDLDASVLFLGDVSAIAFFAMCCLHSGLLDFFAVVNSVLVIYLTSQNRIRSCSAWTFVMILLMLPMIAYLFSYSAFLAIVLEIITVVIALQTGK